MKGQAMKTIAWAFIVIQILLTVGSYKAETLSQLQTPIVFNPIENAVAFVVYNLLAIGAVILGRLRNDKKIIIGAFLAMIISLPLF